MLTLSEGMELERISRIKRRISFKKIARELTLREQASPKEQISIYGYVFPKKRIPHERRKKKDSKNQTVGRIRSPRNQRNRLIAGTLRRWDYEDEFSGAYTSVTGDCP